MVAQIDKGYAPMIATAMNPAGDSMSLFECAIDRVTTKRSRKEGI
jgi:hypothetical protein